MRFRRWFLQDDEHLIRIISWMPIITRDEIFGPLLLVRRGGSGSTHSLDLGYAPPSSPLEKRS